MTRRDRSIVVSVALVVIGGAAVGSAQFLEDFQGGVWPAGWVRQNLDGNTPASGVSEYTDAWVVLEPEAAGAFVAGSTSWYDPVGTANDWMITPAVTPAVGDVLGWRGLAPDSSFPDGYVVYYSTTTQDSVGCLANPPLLTVAAEAQTWTRHQVDVTALAGTPTYFCFQNNSNDQFVLWLDDIRVGIPIQFDLSLEAVENPYPYGWFPTFMGGDFVLRGYVTNAGAATLTDVSMAVDVDYNGTPQPTVWSNSITALGAGASDELAAANVLAGAAGTYTFAYAAGMAESDEAPEDNSAGRIYFATSSYLCRSDWDSIAGAVGFGTPTGHFGVMYDTGQELQVQGVDFVMQGLTEGTTYNAYLWTWDPDTGQPGAIVATSEPFVRTAEEYDYVYVEFPGGPVAVGAQFFVSVYEPNELNMGMFYSDHVYTPGTLFYKIDGSAWTPTTFNFLIGVELVPPPNTAPVVTISAPSDPSSVSQFDLVTFTGTASDVEDGELTASLAWSSDRDGALGAGGSFAMSTLSVGTHLVTASVTDSGALVGTDTVTVTVSGNADVVFVNGFESGGLGGWSTSAP